MIAPASRFGARRTIRMAAGLQGLILAGLLLAAVSFSSVATSLDSGLAAIRMDVLKRQPSGNVTIVKIDPASLNAAGDWPWPRERYAGALSNLNAAGAGMIAFDVDFSARSTPEGDAALKAAIDENPGWIVLPVFLQRDYEHKNSPFGQIGESAILGSVNIELSSDGRARTYRRGYIFGNAYYPTLGGLLAGAEPGDVRNFQLDYGIEFEKIDTISFDDVLNGRFDKSLVENRNILIGATATELGDLVSTPHAAAVPGVYIHALGYESLLQGRALVSPPMWMSFAAGLLVLIGGVWMSLTRKLALNIAAQAGIAFAAVLVSFVLQAIYPISISIAPVLFATAWNVGHAIRRLYHRKETQLIEQKSAYLKHMVRHDSETGLPNRIALLEDLSQSRGTDRATTIVLIVFGIDRFRELRGAFGYANADDLVRKLSDYLKQRKVADEAYRLDRSTVAVWVVAESEHQIEAKIAELQALSTLPVVIAGQTVNLSIRAGVSMIGAGNEQAELELENAVLALDQARIRSKTVVHWEPASSEDPKLKLAMLNDIITGIDRNEFEVVYQPKYSVHEGEFTDLEALIRWNHRRFGFIPPSSFIATAEETGAIDPLTLWVAGQVIRDQAYMRSIGVDVAIAINVSGKSICDLEFCDRLLKLITSTNARISIEITETAVIEHPELAIQGIERFQKSGVRLSIDDYGAGQSSLVYLKTLEAHELKLDRSMILDVTSSQRDRLILKSTIDLAHALDMEVVCEGVEDEATFKALEALGFDKFQGFYFARPMSLESALELFKSQSGSLQKLRTAVS